MATAEELSAFVKEGLSQGLSRADMEKALLSAGWPPERVRDGLARFSDVDFPIPVPRPRPYLSAREAFIYLLLFGTLYFSAFHLGRLIFQFINLAFPEPDLSVFAEERIDDAIRWSIASLVVAFPVFLYLSRLTAREVRQSPSKRASKVRRWLTYLTLFVAAGVLIGDFTTLIHSFLSGEVTARFTLKVLTVGLVAGAAFGYYLHDLRQDEKDG